MQAHVAECASCARQDAAVRRALLLFRNLPAIEPSPDFAARLQSRLRAERREQRALARVAGYGRRGLPVAAGMGAGLLAAGLVLAAAFGTRGPASALTLAPVVVAAARHPVERARTIIAAGAPVLVRDSSLLGADNSDDWSPLNDPAFAASLSPGMPVWPAAVLAAHAPATLGSPQLKLTNLER